MLISKKFVLPCVLFLSSSGCATSSSTGLQILNPPLVVASPADAEEIIFSVAVRNTSAQPTKAGQFYIMNVAKDFSVNPACQNGYSNYGQEMVEIPALQPNQSWKAADKRITDLPGFKDQKCSCKANQCGGGTMRFTLLNQFQQPYIHSQSDFEVKWDKSGAFGKSVVSDQSLAK